MKEIKNVFVQTITKPARKVLIKRGIKATDYFAYCKEVGFDVIELPAANYLMFKGEPFAEEDYCAAIEEVQTAISKYDPALIEAEWDKGNPRIQLEPIGTRGYIELLPIK